MGTGCHALHQVPDAALAPVMDAVLVPAPALHAAKVFQYDSVGVRLDGLVHDPAGKLPDVVVLEAGQLRVQPGQLLRAALLLDDADSRQQAVDGPPLLVERIERAGVDISPGINRGADGPVVDAEVHTEDDLLVRRKLTKLPGLHPERDVQAVLVEGVDKRRALPFSDGRVRLRL